MKILVVMPVEAEHKKVLQDAAPDAQISYVSAKDVTKEEALEADIIVGNLSPALIKDSKKLKLMQLNSAGTDGYTAPGVLPEQTTLCNATGSYGLAIAEHMLGAVLMMMKKFDRYRLSQEKHEWTDYGSVNSIYGSKTLIIGLGDIGNEFAVRMHALGSQVSGVKRRLTEKPEYIEKLYTMDELQEALKDADIVAACLPNTPATVGVFNKETFSYMKDGALFVNVGRGNAVVQDDLYDALASGKLAGASVDVTVPEPLPEDHKLWTAPNIMITPHISGWFHLRETHNRVIRIAAANIRHCINGEPYETEVDLETGYKK